LIGGEGGGDHTNTMDNYFNKHKNKVKKRGRGNHASPSPDEHSNPKS
jgi:hypothetical protein